MLTYHDDNNFKQTLAAVANCTRVSGLFGHYLQIWPMLTSLPHFPAVLIKMITGNFIVTIHIVKKQDLYLARIQYTQYTNSGFFILVQSEEKVSATSQTTNWQWTQKACLCHWCGRRQTQKPFRWPLVWLSVAGVWHNYFGQQLWNLLFFPGTFGFVG